MQQPTAPWPAAPHAPSTANDGNLTTYSATPESHFDRWWRIQLKRSHFILRIATLAGKLS